jgi:hypothetical protein
MLAHFVNECTRGLILNVLILKRFIKSLPAFALTLTKLKEKRWQLQQ